MTLQTTVALATGTTGSADMAHDPTAHDPGYVRSFATDPSPSYLAMLAAEYGMPVRDSHGRVWLIPGQSIRIRLPYSEVCMHMRVADTVMTVQLTTGAEQSSAFGAHPMAQLVKDDGGLFSFPITTGEAGIYGNSRDGHYCYPDGV